MSLDRFLTAQDGVFEVACAELRAGRKRSHWMWFMFPQMRGLGQSAIAHRYGIASRAEAERYLAHDTLGTRLRLVTTLMLAHRGGNLTTILGSPDDRKFCSCQTLFDAISPRDIFGDALAAFRLTRDTHTLALLESKTHLANDNGMT